jgi:hypothetical protein
VNRTDGQRIYLNKIPIRAINFRGIGMAKGLARWRRLPSPAHRGASVVALIAVLIAVSGSAGALAVSSHSPDLGLPATHTLDIFSDEESFGTGPPGTGQPAVPLPDDTLHIPGTGAKPSTTASAAGLTRSPPLT